MGEYASVGPILIGIFINTYLYGIVSYQYVSYLTSKFNDPCWIRSIVLSLFTLDTLHSVTMVYLAWVHAVQDYVNAKASQVIFWPYPLTAITTACAAFLVQTFLGYRIYRLSGSKVGFFALFCLSTSSFALGMTCGIFGWQIQSASRIPVVRKISATWVVTETVVNVLITGLLIFILTRSRTAFHNSNTILDRLVRAFIQTGLFTGICSLGSVILYLTYPKTHFYVIFALPIGRVYSATLMDTLLVRHALREIVAGAKPTRTTAIWELGDNLKRLFPASGGGPTPTGGTPNSRRSIQLHVRTEVWTDRRRSRRSRPGSRSGPGTPQIEVARMLEEREPLAFDGVGKRVREGGKLDVEGGSEGGSRSSCEVDVDVLPS